MKNLFYSKHNLCVTINKHLWMAVQGSDHQRLDLPASRKCKLHSGVNFFLWSSCSTQNTDTLPLKKQPSNHLSEAQLFLSPVFFMHVYVSVHNFLHTCGGIEAFRFSGTRVTGDCNSPDMSAEKETGAPQRVANILHHEAISSGWKSSSLYTCYCSRDCYFLQVSKQQECW